MDKNDAYIFGWCFGRVCRLWEDYGESVDGYQQASELARLHPLRGLYAMETIANRERKMTEDARNDLTAALSQVIGDGDSGLYGIDHDTASHWMMGYYVALSGKGMVGSYNIAAAREAKGWTQQQLADAMGVPQSHVSRWETGKVTPKIATMEKIKSLLKPDEPET